MSTERYQYLRIKEGGGEKVAIVQVSVLPVGTPSPSFSSYISDCYRVVKNEAGLKSQVTPTATVIEGELDHVLELVKKMHQVPFANGIQRVVTSITIDERRDKEESMQSMIDAVL